MKGICHIWSRGRLISPSMIVGDDWYLNLNSQKRPPGRNLGEHRLVRRSGTASRGTVVLVFCLRMRSFIRTEVPTIFMGRNICVGSTKNLTQTMKFTRATWLFNRSSLPSRPEFSLTVHYTYDHMWQITVNRNSEDSLLIHNFQPWQRLSRNPIKSSTIVLNRYWNI